jgi:hypothetical protein
MVYPRPVDLEATDKIRAFPYTQVVENVEDLRLAVLKRLAALA